MKKIIKSRIFLVIICGLIFTSFGIYAANTYKASDVVYNASDGTSMNVNDALNELYNKNESNLKVYYLGTGTSYDLSKIDGYQNFTIDNFIIEFVSMGDYVFATHWSGVSEYTGSSSVSISKTYDSSTGKLTIGNISGSLKTGGNVNSHSYTISIKVYLVIGNIGTI